VLAVLVAGAGAGLELSASLRGPAARDPPVLSAHPVECKSQHQVGREPYRDGIIQPYDCESQFPVIDPQKTDGLIGG
jgi:hypothetical protein